MKSISYRHTFKSMLNIVVVSFYDNFGLIFKLSEDMATKGIENLPLSRPRVRILSNIRTNLESPETRVSANSFATHSVGVGLSSFVFTKFSLNKARQKNLVKPTMITDFSIKWHLKVV